MTTSERPRYGTWIRTRPIIILSLLEAACLALTALAAWSVLFLAALVPAAIVGYVLLIVTLSRWRFSPVGGNYQDRVHELLVRRVEGLRILDIGCGSGHLLARIAGAHPAARLVGLDFWGEDWEYSQALCERNAKVEGFEGRVAFVRGSASALPADLGTFDTVVSCLTFHEVRDTPDRTTALAEAVARVTPGGAFAFIDLFGDPKFYPQPERISEAITRAGGRVTERTALGELLALPFPLEHPRVLGHAVLIAGRREAP